MTATRRLSRNYANADLAAIDELLDQLTDEDFLTRQSLEERRSELLEEMQAWKHEEEPPTASVAIFFGGRPVVGSRGIESEFGGNAIVKYQDIVAKLAVIQAGHLGQRGIVPQKATSTLHVTNIARGSFGFLLEELAPQGELVDTSLKDAVETATELLSAFGDEDEERFQKIAETVDQRVINTAGEFFRLLSKENATMRVVTGRGDSSIDRRGVHRAYERASSTRIDEVDRDYSGRLGGFLPVRRQFEFHTPERTISGRVDKALAPEQLQEFNRTLAGQDAIARIKVKTVVINAEVKRERESFLLLGIRPVDSSSTA